MEPSRTRITNMKKKKEAQKIKIQKITMKCKTKNLGSPSPKWAKGDLNKHLSIYLSILYSVSVRRPRARIFSQVSRLKTRGLTRECQKAKFFKISTIFGASNTSSFRAPEQYSLLVKYILYHYILRRPCRLVYCGFG
jgi:hypothetical protein